MANSSLFLTTVAPFLWGLFMNFVPNFAANFVGLRGSSFQVHEINNSAREAPACHYVSVVKQLGL